MNTQTNPAFNGMQIMQMKQELIGNKFSEMLATEKFPVDRLSSEWLNLADKSRRKASPLSLRISVQDYVAMQAADFNDLTFYQFGCISNSLECLSMADTKLEPDEYQTVMKEAIEHIEFYGEEIKKWRAQIELDAEREISMKIAAEAAAKNHGGLQSVNAQA